VKEETKIELMKIAAHLTSDAVPNLGKGIKVGSVAHDVRGVDIKDLFAECLAGAKEQFDKLG
jgi:hypothetical protein